MKKFVGYIQNWPDAPGGQKWATWPILIHCRIPCVAVNILIIRFPTKILVHIAMFFYMRTKVKTISILWIKISPKFGLQGSKLASKWSKMAKINIFSKLKELGCWFLIISSIFHPEEFSYNKFRLPKLLVTQISPSGVAERSPKWPKKGKINIISKLKGLGYWFFILSPHFPPRGVQPQ